MLFTPEGRLLDEFTSAGPFVEFEAAKRKPQIFYTLRGKGGEHD